jgi:hypothetical protein
MSATAVSNVVSRYCQVFDTPSPPSTTTSPGIRRAVSARSPMLRRTSSAIADDAGPDTTAYAEVVHGGNADGCGHTSRVASAANSSSPLISIDSVVPVRAFFAVLIPPEMTTSPGTWIANPSRG